MLPSRTRLMGVPGASRLIYSGDGHFLIGENGTHIELTGLVIDGANRGLHSYAEAAVRISNTDHVVIDNCQVLGSIEKGIQIDRSKGGSSARPLAVPEAIAASTLSKTRGFRSSTTRSAIVSMAAFWFIAGKMARTAPLLSGNRISTHWRCQWRHGPMGQWYQCVPGGKCHGRQQPDHRLCLFCHPLQCRK